MFYTPLLRSDGEQLGVCDSSCDSITDVDVWTALYSEEKKHPTTTHVLHSHTDKGGSLPEYLFACNLTKTLPEDDVPEQIKDAFPYNMRTCFLESSLVNHKIRRALEVYSQKTFEKVSSSSLVIIFYPDCPR